MRHAHILVAEIHMAGGQKVLVPIKFFDDKARCEHEHRLALKSASLMLLGSIIADVGGKPMKVASVGQLLKNLGIIGAGYSILSAELEGILETPNGLVIPELVRH